MSLEQNCCFKMSVLGQQVATLCVLVVVVFIGKGCPVSASFSGCNKIIPLSSGEYFTFPRFPPSLPFLPAPLSSRCSWSFRAVDGCRGLELETLNWENGAYSSGCRAEKWTIGDGTRETKFCGAKSPPAWWRAAGEQLDITHHHRLTQMTQMTVREEQLLSQYPLGGSAIWGGVVRCVESTEEKYDGDSSCPPPTCVPQILLGNFVFDFDCSHKGNCTFEIEMSPREGNSTRASDLCATAPGGTCSATLAAYSVLTPSNRSSCETPLPPANGTCTTLPRFVCPPEDPACFYFLVWNFGDQSQVGDACATNDGTIIGASCTVLVRFCLTATATDGGGV